MEREYKTQFGRKAIEGDYVLRAFIDKVVYSRGITHKAVTHVGKIQNGFVYFSREKRVFAENQSADLICVINSEDVKSTEKQHIEDVIKKYQEETQKERYFKILSLNDKLDLGKVLYAKTTKLSDENPLDIKKYLQKIIRERGVNYSRFQYQEIDNETEFLRMQRAGDTSEIISDIQINI